MASNVDKYVTDSEHAAIDHTGVPGVPIGGSAAVTGAEVIEIDYDFASGSTASKTIAANTLTADLQMLEIKWHVYGGTGAPPSVIFSLAGNTVLSTALTANEYQFYFWIVRTGATTCRVSAGWAGSTVASSTASFTVDWGAVQSLSYTSAGGTGELHRVYQALKWPAAGALGVSGIGSDTLPIGTIVPFGGPISAVPVGFLPCDGSAVSRATYGHLFTALSNGAIWGTGDGSTTFNVPDLRAKSPLGLNDGTLPAGADGGYSTRNMGAVAGEENHQLTIAELANHNHGVSAHGVTQTTTGAIRFQSTNGAQDNTLGTFAQGSDTAHNTMHPFAVVAYIIKAQQVGGGIGVTGQQGGGALQGPQPTLNFIASGAAAVAVLEDALNNRIDITISAPTPTANNYIVLDSTSTFATINAALANPAYDIVYLKRGNYFHPYAQITVPAGKQLIGLTGPCGDDPAEVPSVNPVLKPNTTGAHSFIQVNGDGVVKNIWIQGSIGGPLGATDYCIEQIGLQEPIWLENIRVNNWGKFGPVTVPGLYVGRGRFIHCAGVGCKGSGFICGNPGTANEHATIFEGCIAHNNEQHGFEITDGDGQLFLHCRTWQNHTNGYNIGLGTINRLRFLSCHAEFNSVGGWNWIGSANVGCSIEDCSAAGQSTGWGFLLGAATGTLRARISNCVGLLNGGGDFSVGAGWAQFNNSSAT